MSRLTISWKVGVSHADGKPAGKLEIALQYLTAEGKGWEALATAMSDGSGSAAGRAQLEVGAQFPALRLVLAGGSDVLAATPEVITSTMVTGRGVMAEVDFGTVTLLAQKLLQKNAGYARVAVESAVVAQLQTVASPEYKAMQSRLEQAAAQFKTLQGQLQSAREQAATDQRELQAQLERKSGELTDLQQQMQASVDKARREMEEVRVRLTRQLDDKATEVETWQQQLRSLEETANARQKSLNAELVASRSLVRKLEEEVALVKEERDQAYAAGRAEGEGKEVDPRTRRAIKFATLADTLGRDMDQAAQALAGDKSAFRLANVHILAKGRFLAREDGEMQFIPAAEGDDAEGLSSADLSFAADEPEAPVLEVGVPDVLGLTESAARRVLSSLGLRLQPSYGPASIRAGSARGQAMLQTPEAGAAAARGAGVTVVFAR